MKTCMLSVLMLMLSGIGAYAQSPSGKAIFSANCQACHSIGKGDVLGPDLAGITERREADWIKSFVTNSQKMVSEGDEAAVEVFTKYNKIAMPSHSFNEEEMNGLLSYLGEASQEVSAAQAQATTQAEETSTQPAEVVVQAGAGGEVSLFVKLILGVLSIAAVLLAAIAIYLARFLNS